MRLSAILVLQLALLSPALWGCGRPLPQPSPAPRVSLRLLVRGDHAERTAGAVTTPHLKLEITSLDNALARVAGTTPRRPGAPLAEATQALTRAREHYRKLAFESALEQLNRAQGLLVPLAREPAHFELLGRVSLRRGLNLLALRQREAAAQALRWALALGQVQQTPGRFPPDVEALLAELRARKPPTGSLSFVAPAGARIELDGKPRGTVPATVSLPPGLCHVRLSQLGRKPRALLQLVAPGKVDRVALSLERSPTGELAGQLSAALDAGDLEQLAPLAPMLARVLPREQAALFSRASTSSELLWLKPGAAAGPHACGDPEASRCLADRLYLLATGKRPPSRRPTPRVSKPFYKRWWFWTAVGVVAAGAGVTTAVVATRPEDGTDVEIVSKP